MTYIKTPDTMAQEANMLIQVLAEMLTDPTWTLITGGFCFWVIGDIHLRRRGLL